MIAGIPPFFSKDERTLMKMIDSKEVEFKRFMSEESKDLLKQLLEKNHHKRLCCFKRLKEHDFFKNINWEDVKSRNNKLPKLSDEIKTRRAQTQS
jgi:serine/threonine protein kinase